MLDDTWNALGGALAWLFERRSFWAPAAILLAVAALAPFYSRWSGWILAHLRRGSGSSAAAGRIPSVSHDGTDYSERRSYLQVLNFLNRQEPDLAAELARRLGGAQPVDGDTRRKVRVGYWVEIGLPLLQRYAPRASDESLILLFEYIEGVAVLLHQRGDDSSFQYIAANPLDPRLGAEADPAFIGTADALLGEVFWSAVDQPPRTHEDGENLLVAATRRAVGRSAGLPSTPREKAGQYLAILAKVLEGEPGDAAAMLRYLISTSRVTMFQIDAKPH